MAALGLRVARRLSLGAVNGGCSPVAMFLLYVTCCFSLAAFNILFFCLVFVSLISMCLGIFLHVYPVWDSLCLLDLIDYFLFHVGEIFNYNPFKNFLIFSNPFFFSSSSGIPIIQMLVHLTLSQRSLRLSSALFILFTLFCSSEVISTILSSSSLIHFMLQIFCY